MHLTLATRTSALALAQTRAFWNELVKRNPGLSVEELPLVTQGDKTQDRSLQDIGGKGLFIKELEEALLDGRADFAVHSIKDVPAELASDLCIACIPAREDPRDALISKSGLGLPDLPKGSVVGTSSLRRALSLLSARPDLRIEPLRGNVDTRLRKVAEGPLDAAVLALAGLKRLGLAHRAAEILSPEISLPAIGQGALGIECRSRDEAILSVLSTMNDVETSICVSAERAVMAALSGNCRTPIAAYAERRGGQLFLRAFVAEPDGTRMRRGERWTAFPAHADEAKRLGDDLGTELKHG